MRKNVDIIDLDLLDSIEEVDGTAIRKIHVAFASFYCANKISASDWITLKVWLGLLKEIPEKEKKLSTGLAFAVALKRVEENDPSFLVGAAMVSSEMMRVFSLDEQHEILRRIE